MRVCVCVCVSGKCFIPLSVWARWVSLAQMCTVEKNIQKHWLLTDDCQPQAYLFSERLVATTAPLSLQFCEVSISIITLKHVRFFFTFREVTTPFTKHSFIKGCFYKTLCKERDFFFFFYQKTETNITQQEVCLVFLLIFYYLCLEKPFFLHRHTLYLVVFNVLIYLVVLVKFFSLGETFLFLERLLPSKANSII